MYGILSGIKVLSENSKELDLKLNDIILIIPPAITNKVLSKKIVSHNCPVSMVLISFVGCDNFKMTKNRNIPGEFATESK